MSADHVESRAVAAAEREAMARQRLRAHAAMLAFWLQEVQTEPEGSVTRRVALAELSKAQVRYASALAHWEAAYASLEEVRS